jgi:hypothetical protein
MHIFLDTIIFILMGLIVYSDFRSRSVWLILFPFAFVILFFRSFLLISLELLLYNSLINLGFVLLQLFMLSIYFSLKNHKPTNIINKYIGLADILLLIACCFCFSPLNFMMFLFFNLIICLVISVIFYFNKKKTSIQLPLAGVLALSLGGLIILSYFNNATNLFNDGIWINLITKIL